MTIAFPTIIVEAIDVRNTPAGDLAALNVQDALNELDTEKSTGGDITTAINAAIAALVDSSPATLDTLNELAAALGDDANFATTVTNALAGKVANSLFDAHTILAAVSDNTPVAVTIAEQRFVGRVTGGNITALTGTQAAVIIDAMVGDSGAGGTKGQVPAPAAGDAAAGRYLKADGTWEVPGSSADIDAIYEETDASTITFDYANGRKQFVDQLGDNRTIDVDNMISGSLLKIWILDTNNKTLTWTPTIRWHGGAAPVLPDTTGKGVCIILEQVDTQLFGEMVLTEDP